MDTCTICNGPLTKLGTLGVLAHYRCKHCGAEMSEKNQTRLAVVHSDDISIADYLPSNYRVTDIRDGQTFIAGEDNCGWTLDAYVIPRLASGLYHCREYGND